MNRFLALKELSVRQWSFLELTEDPLFDKIRPERYAAVSYTHLDVYKRQVKNWGGCLFPSRMMRIVQRLVNCGREPPVERKTWYPLCAEQE